MAEEIERLITVWDANFAKLDEKLDKINRKHAATAAKVLKDANAMTNRLEAQYGRVGKALDNVFNDTRLATLNAGTSRLALFGNALEPLGPWGIAAAAGVAALGIATTQTIAAMKFADEIDDAAQKLAIGTDALQEYRFAMTEVGGETGDADSAIKSFTTTLGLAQSGLSPKAMKGFAALGFTKAQLDSFGSGEEALTAVASRIAALSKESEQAAVAEKLGLGPMLPLLREGADGMEALRKKAEDLGYVMDADLVKKGADANQQFETMSHIIDVQMKSAFVDLSDEVLGFVGVIANALKGLNDFIDASKRLGGINLKDPVSAGNDAGQAWGLAGGWKNSPLPHLRRRYDEYQTSRARDAAELDDPALQRQTRAAGALAVSAGQNRLAAPSAGGGNTAAKAGRDEEQRVQRQRRFDDQLERIRTEIIRSSDRTLLSIDDEAADEVQELERERAAQLKTIVEGQADYVRSKGLKGISDTEAAQLKAAQDELTEQKKSVVEWRRRADNQKAQEKADDDLANFAREALSARASVAVTEEDRYRLELELLTLQQDERRRMLERAARDDSASDAERAAAQSNLNALPGMERNETEGARMGRTAVRSADSIANDVIDQGNLADQKSEMYDRIDELRQQDVLSEEQAAQAKALINASYEEKRLAATSDFFGNLATLSSSSNKTLAAIGKAAAIAQATIDGYLAVQNAWAHVPFPFNIAAAASIGVATAANVAKIAGMADGGWVEGAGGPRQDNQLRYLSVGEHVTNAAAAARNRPVLDFINKGGNALNALRGASASEAAGRTGFVGGAMTFAPNIDARGADRAAIRELRAMMTEQQEQFEARVMGVQARKARYRLGKNRDT